LTIQRTCSVGAECVAGGVEFRVWALGHSRVELELEGTQAPLALAYEPNAPGYFSLQVAQAHAGTRYRYRVDGEGPFPDPASRFQPAGPHGWSEVIDPKAFAWSDASWPGITLQQQVFYELHVGTFTEQGTFAAAQTKLDHLRELGISCIELMPLADFPGDFGWGYDGVQWYAPHWRYGRPDELRAFVDAAHRVGLGVILDVVYNHLGPAGNYLPAFSASYFSKQATEWGVAPNFSGEDSRPVRDFVSENAAYWVRDFHLDGFRLDATQSLYDDSPEHIISELTRTARAAAGARGIVVVAENEPQEAKLARPAADGGYGIDGLWNDDFHHSAMVALTGRREAYYTDYLGRAQEFVAAAKRGFLYQGQYYVWQDKRRGTSTRGLPAHAFIAYIENHDQVSNSAASDRLCMQCSPSKQRAISALLLLGPWTPLLFQGQEWSSAQPFPYFAQHTAELAKLVHKGRRQSLAQFPSLATPAVQDRLPDPGAPETFASAKLDWAAQLTAAACQRSLALHRDLLRLRRNDAVLASFAAGDASLDGAALNDQCVLLRWFGPDTNDRLLLVNLGPDLALRPAPEPLLAPPDDRAWQLVFSSEDPRYGGLGQPELPSDARGFVLPASSALFFVTTKREAT
jgi:maltooligosyltrehalose trehalohydrolase